MEGNENRIFFSFLIVILFIVFLPSLSVLLFVLLEFVVSGGVISAE